MNVTKKIAEYIYKTNISDIPQDILDTAKLCFLDWLGVTIAGAKTEFKEVAQEYLSLNSKHGTASIIGRNQKADLQNASLINGIFSHALDFDDYHMTTILHSTAPTFPAVIATAEYAQSNGEELLLSLILALDVTLRIGKGVRRVHYDRGWHITPTIGRFGAVAGVARLLHLDTDTIINALGIAGTTAGGLRNVFGSMSKPYHVGKAAMDGLMACFFAQKGLDSSPDIFGGEHGFFDLFTENPDYDSIITGMGKDFLLNEICFKTYPAPL